MSKDERLGWRAALKVGDEVALRKLYADGYEMLEVRRITPTGQIVLVQKHANGEESLLRFTSDGWGISPESRCLFPVEEAQEQMRLVRQEQQFKDMLRAAGEGYPLRWSAERMERAVKTLGPAYGDYIRAQKALGKAVRELVKQERQNEPDPTYRKRLQ